MFDKKMVACGTGLGSYTLVVRCRCLIDWFDQYKNMIPHVSYATNPTIAWSKSTTGPSCKVDWVLLFGHSLMQSPCSVSKVGSQLDVGIMLNKVDLNIPLDYKKDNGHF